MGAIGSFRKKIQKASGKGYDVVEIALYAVLRTCERVEGRKAKILRGDITTIRYAINKYATEGEKILLARYLK